MSDLTEKKVLLIEHDLLVVKLCNTIASLRAGGLSENERQRKYKELWRLKEEIELKWLVSLEIDLEQNIVWVSSKESNNPVRVLEPEGNHTTIEPYELPILIDLRAVYPGNKTNLLKKVWEVVIKKLETEGFCFWIDIKGEDLTTDELKERYEYLVNEVFPYLEKLRQIKKRTLKKYVSWYERHLEGESFADIARREGRRNLDTTDIASRVRKGVHMVFELIHRKRYTRDNFREVQREVREARANIIYNCPEHGRGCFENQRGCEYAREWMRRFNEAYPVGLSHKLCRLNSPHCILSSKRMASWL